MEQARWQPVAELPAADPDPLRAVLAAAGGRGRYVRSDAGGRGAVVPWPVLPARAEQVEQVLFVQPATGADALAALGALGEDAEKVRVALPEGADATGLAAEPGVAPLTVGPDRFRVYRVVGAPADRRDDRARLAAAPRVGESADVTDQRAKWFQAREGGAR